MKDEKFTFHFFKSRAKRTLLFSSHFSVFTLFLVRRGQMLSLGKKNADGLYFGVLPIRIFFC